MPPHALSPARMQDRAARLAALDRVPREVYHLVAEAERPIKAYDLLWRLQEKRGRPAPPSTIYRAIAVLIEAGLAHKIESLNAFVLCAIEDEAHEPLFLICDTCAGAFETSLGETKHKVEQQALRAGFEVSRLNFVVHGTCARCSKA